MPPQVNPEQRAATVTRLRQLRAAGHLTSRHVRLAADGLGVAERTVWRWLGEASGEQGRRRGRAPYRLSEMDREALAFFHGSVAAVHRARTAVVATGTGDGPVLAAGLPVPAFLIDGWAGAEPVSLRTLQESFARELTPAERAAWRSGEEGHRQAQVYLQRPPMPRNHTWETDHKQLPILVLPPRGPAVKPWLTTVVDDGTRALLGWAIAITPHAGTVLTALRMAMVHEPERGPFGAVPTLVRIDRGLEFAAAAVHQALAALCVDEHRLPAFTPHRKGKVERIQRTVDQTMLHALPGFTKGPRDAAGRLYGPLDDRLAARLKAATASVGPMRIERFAALFASWAAWYNTERVHSMLDGRTPLQAWMGDVGPLHRVDADKLRHLLLAGAEATIGKYGIRRNNLHYTAPELQGRGGQKVAIRFMPHDDRIIEVYLDGTHLCTATPAACLTDEQRQAFRDHATTERKRLGRERRKASARARVELAPLTGDGPAEESRLLPPQAADELAARRGAGLLRRKARTDLLLGPLQPATPPRPVPDEKKA